MPSWLTRPSGVIASQRSQIVVAPSQHGIQPRGALLLHQQAVRGVDVVGDRQRVAHERSTDEAGRDREPTGDRELRQARPRAARCASSPTRSYTIAREYAVCASEATRPFGVTYSRANAARARRRQVCVANVVVTLLEQICRGRDEVERVDHRRGGQEIGIRPLIERIAAPSSRIEPVGELEAAGPEEIVSRQLELELDPGAHARILRTQDVDISEALVHGRRHGDGGVTPALRRGAASRVSQG